MHWKNNRKILTQYFLSSKHSISWHFLIQNNLSIQNLNRGQIKKQHKNNISFQKIFFISWGGMSYYVKQLFFIFTVKSVLIQSYSGLHFSTFVLNTNQNNSEYWHFPGEFWFCRFLHPFHTILRSLEACVVRRFSAHILARCLDKSNSTRMYCANGKLQEKTNWVREVKLHIPNYVFSLYVRFFPSAYNPHAFFQRGETIHH